MRGHDGVEVVKRAELLDDRRERLENRSPTTRSDAGRPSTSRSDGTELPQLARHPQFAELARVGLDAESVGHDLDAK